MDDCSEAGIRRNCWVRQIPEYMVDGIERYVVHGVRPGDFLVAIFSNDLMGAMHRADVNNFKLIQNYCQLLHNDLPMPCFGSSAKVDAWCARGGLVGRGAARLAAQSRRLW